MIPVLIGLIFWWIPKKSNAIVPEKTFKETLFDMFPKQYIKRFIIAMIIVGVRKFIISYPRAKEFIDNVKDVLNKQSK